MQSPTIDPTIDCAFCGQRVPSLHQCAGELLSILNSLATPKTDKTAFNNIDNLVFQGGGVKGVAYLGVIEQLNQDYPEFLSNIKRIAGTSAGSMLALYLGLNMKYADIHKLIYDKSYLKLLDTDIKLNVCTNPGAIFSSWKYIVPSVRNVILSAYVKYKEIGLKAMNPSTQDEAKKLMKAELNNILNYYKRYQGFGYSALKFLLGSTFVKNAVAWLITFLDSDKSDQDEKRPVSSALFVEMTKLNPTPQEAQQPSTEQKDKSDTNDDTVSGSPTDHTSVLASTLHNLFNHSFEELVAEHEEEMKKDVREAVDVPEEGMVYMEREVIEHMEKPLNSAPPTNSEDSNWTDPVLADEYLSYSVAELLYYLFYSSKDAVQVRDEVGLFTASKIKEELIEKPIQDRLNDYGITKKDPTFADLAACTDKDGKKCFRDFYIASFNSRTLRTEVFSADHTPNVIVADAVRASMSIPVFFTPVYIRENGAPREIYYEKTKKTQPISYMDGGVFDNYALWIFDDLKYCLPPSIQWKPTQRITVANSRTLGFKLIDPATLEKYLQPTVPGRPDLLKSLVDNEYTGSFFNQIMTLGAAEVGGHEESNYINNGDWTRTAYVDNCNVSALAFSMDDKQKDKLMQSGRQAVIDFRARAERNFAGEGQKYY